VVFASAGPTTAYVQTDANGHFTWQFTPTLLDYGNQWQVLTDTPGVQQAQFTGTVHIAVPLQFTEFSASLNPFGVLSVTACAQTQVQGAFIPGSLVIQYSASPSGPWKRLGKLGLSTLGTTSCSPNNYFSGKLGVQLANAYYRAYFPATVDNQAKASKVLHRWKYLTRIVSLSVSPGSVAAGGRITVSGRLEQQAGRSWRGYGHRVVLIVLRPRGSKRFYWIKKVTTNSRGHFSKTLTDPVTAAWSAAYDGDATHFASGGKIVNVTVAALPNAVSERGTALRLERTLAPVRFGIGLRSW